MSVFDALWLLLLLHGEMRVLFYDFRQSNGVLDDECDVTECVKAYFSSVKCIDIASMLSRCWLMFFFFICRFFFCFHSKIDGCVV